jgi:hypothetical protein
VKIFVLDNAWVLLARVAREDSKTVDITDASVIRIWGTSKGLGELAMSGPTAQTKLDKFGVGRIQKNKLLFTIDCDPKIKWK